MIWRGALIRHAAMLGAAMCAALLTPSGPRLYMHTLGYLRDSYLVDNTQEYMSPDFHTARFALIAIVLVTVSSSPIASRRRPSFRSLAVITINLAFSLVSGRNLALFGIVALPLVAEELQRARPPGCRICRVAPAARLSPDSGSVVRLVFGWPLAAVVAMAVLGAGPRSARRCIRGTSAPRVRSGSSRRSTRTCFPSARSRRRERLKPSTGHMFHEFTWGGYVLYAWPEQRVFIDGQTDFYGDSITREFTQIIGVMPGWRRKLDAWTISLVLVETGSPLADALVHERGWRPAYCDSTAVLFRRDDAAGPALGQDIAISPSCTNLSILPSRPCVDRLTP